jgi:hypothetical protein
VHVEPLTPDLREAALDYLARSPYLNVFITHVLCHELGPDVRKNVFVAIDGDEVAGVVTTAVTSFWPPNRPWSARSPKAFR